MNDLSNWPRNRLLLALPTRNLKRLMPALEQIRCQRALVLMNADSSLDHVFFPDSGVVSVLAVYADGSIIEMATIGREGCAGVQAALGAKSSSPAATLARMNAELAAAHCGLLPDTIVSSMVTVLTVRDAFMASMLARSAHVTGTDAAVLIAGIGHTRGDRGVPWHLRRLLPRENILSIDLIEVRDGKTNPDSYAAAFQTERLPFDYVWFTPRADAEDPCKKYRDELQRAKAHPYDLVP